MLHEFFVFIKEYNVLGLSLAVVIGAKVSAWVNSLVNDILLPAIFNPALKAAKIDDIRALKVANISIGAFIGATIDFIIVAFVIFFIVKVFLKQKEIQKI